MNIVVNAKWNVVVEDEFGNKIETSIPGENKINNTYDSKNNLLCQIKQVWINDDWINDDWINDYKITYIYDDNRNMIIFLKEYWDSKKNVWENFFRHTYTYNKNNHMTCEIRQRWIDDCWEDSEVYNVTYDDAGNELTYSYKKWTNIVNR